MAWFYVIYKYVISKWRLFRPVAINQYDITMATHYNITMGNDVSRDTHCNIATDIYCDITLSNDVAICTYHGITVHNDVAMNLFYNVFSSFWLVKYPNTYTTHVIKYSLVLVIKSTIIFGTECDLSKLILQLKIDPLLYCWFYFILFWNVSFKKNIYWWL